jgi:hypothetical protein
VTFQTGSDTPTVTEYPQGQMTQQAIDTSDQFIRRERLLQSLDDAKLFGNGEKVGPVKAAAS